jgi:phosphoglycolate phosphatase-like HAD superfamily hydrolase
MTQGTLTTTTPQDAGPPKRSIIQIGGLRKKAKAHKDILEYTITEDDADLVAERVQDHATEEYEEVENQRERIMKELAEVKQVLEWIQAPKHRIKDRYQHNDRQRKGTKPGALRTQYKS